MVTSGAIEKESHLLERKTELVEALKAFRATFFGGIGARGIGAGHRGHRAGIGGIGGHRGASGPALNLSLNIDLIYSISDRSELFL